MSKVQQLAERRKEILVELASLQQIRRGSIVEQYFDDTLKDGTKIRRGPYALYSYKEKKKTVSIRLTDAEQIPVYKKQIDNFRRFEKLTSELLAIGEQLSALMISEGEVKKTLRRR